MGKPLVIVESPAKAKTIAAFLGSDYHRRVVDRAHPGPAPQRRRRVPAAYKGESWARLGVDVDNDFKPLYVVSREKRDQVTQAGKAWSRTPASSTSPPTRTARASRSPGTCSRCCRRRSRSSAWSSTRSPARPSSGPSRSGATSTAAWSTPRRPGASSTGCTATRSRPVLWKKVMPGLSAGRVQSVATRLVVERERARMRFRSASFWDLDGRSSSATRRGPAASAPPSSRSTAGVASRAGISARRASGRRPGRAPARRGGGARGLAARLADSRRSRCARSSERPYRRPPHAPFMTSTLQQEAGRKLRFGAQRTMQVAQRLYEKGYITYMRTDSTTLSDEALARGPVAGPPAVRRRLRARTRPAATTRRSRTPRRPTRPSGPAGETFRTPERGHRAARRRAAAVRAGVEADGRLPDGRRRRDRASQLRLGSERSRGRGRGRGRRVRHERPGHHVPRLPAGLRGGSDDPDAELEDREVRLPALAVGDRWSGRARSRRRATPPSRRPATPRRRW